MTDIEIAFRHIVEALKAKGERIKALESELAELREDRERWNELETMVLRAPFRRVEICVEEFDDSHDLESWTVEIPDAGAATLYSTHFEDGIRAVIDAARKGTNAD